MAFPSVRATTYVEEPSDTTSHDVDLTGVAAGDRLVLFAVVDTETPAPVLSGFPAGWSQTHSDSNTSGAGQLLEVWEKVDATGSETSFTYTTSNSQQSKNRVFMVSGSHTSQAMEASTAAGQANNNPDPGSLTPSWGAEDTLWIALYSSDNQRDDATAYPASYADNQYTNTVDTDTGTSVAYGVATRELNATAEDPGTFTKGFTNRWRAVTLAVRPSASTVGTVGRAIEVNTARSLTVKLGLSFPDAPTGLSAVSPAPGSVDLAWTGVTDAEGRTVGYDVRRQLLDGPGGSPVGDPEIVAFDVLDTEWTDVTVAQAATYEYEVRASIVILPTIRQVEEFDEAVSLVGVLAAQVSVASESDSARPLTHSTSGTGPGAGFGAGAAAAPLAVPGNAITATPSTLATLINANPAGSNFALVGGTYNGNFPNKAGNGYFGNSGNHQTVVFNGNVTYPSLALGANPNGGTFEAMDGLDNNIWANLTIKRYRGNNDNNGSGPIGMGGSSGWLFRNVLFEEMHKSGMRVGGANGEFRYCTSRYNGQYCFGGSGSNIHFYNCEMFSSGDSNMIAQAVAPQHETSDRGISKFNNGDRIQLHTCYIHDISGYANGLWWDGNVTNMMAEDCLVEDITRHGILSELSHDGIIRRNTLNNVATIIQPQLWRDCGISVFTSGPFTVEDNVINGARTGIGFYQNDRDTGGDPTKWSAACGSVVQNNTISNITENWVSAHATYTKDGCNFITTPSGLTITTNTYVGTPTFFRTGGQIDETAWNALGYS